MNESVNFDDAETVMRELATRIPQPSRIPDRETGEREIWIGFQSGKFQGADGLEPVPRGKEQVIGEIDEQADWLVDDVGPDGIRWPDLGFASFYTASWDVFRWLRDAGVIAPDVRFQVEYPSPLAFVTTYVDRADAARVEPSYEQAVFADVDKLLAVVPHDAIAVQFDLPVEMGALELPDAFAISDDQDLASIAAGVARWVDQIPADVPVGLHLCCGDYLHRRWKEPESLDGQVRLLNAVASAARRDVGWCAFAVPQYARDAAYFAPLAGLPSATELYLSLVPSHPEEQEPGTTDEQVTLIDELLRGREWGISAECGLVNVERGQLPALLDLHSDMLRRLAPVSSR